MNESKWYKVVFKQIQPIHIGKGSYGVVNETRIFIPGWTMWGALTKAYNLKNERDLSENQELFKNISCFYPCFNKNGNNVLFPEFKNGEFYLGGYSEDEFRAKFVDAFVSTAIDPHTNTALDESLHELNIILPGAKSDFREKDEKKQLYWVGVIDIQNGNNLEEFLKEEKLEIYVGGDLRYGLGKLLLIKKECLENNLPDNWKKKGGYIPVEENDDVSEKVIELLVEIDKPWEKAELRVKLREGKGFYYVPGSYGKNDEKILEKLNNNNNNMELIKGVWCKRS